MAPETFGLTVVEAFACGVPAIVRAAGGSKELVEDNRTGFVYTTDKQLLNAIEQFVNNPALRDSMGACARAHFERDFTRHTHRARYLELINKILGKKADD